MNLLIIDNHKAQDNGSVICVRQADIEGHDVRCVEPHVSREQALKACGQQSGKCQPTTANAIWRVLST